MQAILIDPDKKSIESIEIAGRDDIVKLIAHDTVIADPIGAGDSLFFDEECFLRGASGRFQIDSLIPVSGIGVVAGGTLDTPTQVTGSLDSLKQRLKFL